MFSLFYNVWIGLFMMFASGAYYTPNIKMSTSSKPRELIRLLLILGIGVIDKRLIIEERTVFITRMGFKKREYH